jgi:hypothetical protein
MNAEPRQPAYTMRLCTKHGVKRRNGFCPTCALDEKYPQQEWIMDFKELAALATEAAELQERIAHFESELGAALARMTPLREKIAWMILPVPSPAGLMNASAELPPVPPVATLAIAAELPADPAADLPEEPPEEPRLLRSSYHAPTATFPPPVQSIRQLALAWAATQTGEFTNMDLIGAVQQSRPTASGDTIRTVIATMVTAGQLVKAGRGTLRAPAPREPETEEERAIRRAPF